MTDEQHQEFAQIQVLNLRLGLVTEGFLTFSKIFLDRAADAILWFIEQPQRGLGSSHNYLFQKNRFRRFCDDRSLVSPDRVTKLGATLHSVVGEARNRLIEHTGGRSTWGGPMILGRRAFAIPYRREPFGMANYAPVDLEQLLFDLRRYFSAVLDFLHRNLEAISDGLSAAS
jgi:hypothetical protein